MKIQKIVGETGPLVQLCKGGSCPAAIFTDDGSAFVQGYTPTEAEQAALSAPAGEGFVKMPLATLKKIAEHVTKFAHK